MPHSLLTLLPTIPLFADLSPTTLDDIARVAIRKDYPPEQIIQLEGEPCEYVGFVLTGAVRLYRTNLEGREQVLSSAGPGMHFNTVPALEDGGLLRASAAAVTPAALLLIPVEPYRRLLKTHADLAYAILVDFAGRLDHLTALAADLSLKSVRARLARFLLERADGGEVGEKWTQDEIAATLGTVRDVVGRTLRGFMDRGLIRREGGRLILADRAGLESEAEE
jgi:CRP/FNR family transcriptional regulator, cyclic AMP receptor protein